LRAEVDRARDHLLARPAGAREKHRAARRRHLGDELEDLPQREGAADDVLEAVAGLELTSEIAVLVAEAIALERLLHDDLELGQAERLREVIEGTDLHRRDGGLERRVPADDDHG